MSIKSSNQKGDMLLVSCGNEDNPEIKIWNIKDQSVIGKYAPEDATQQKPYYYLNVIYLEHDVAPEKNIFANADDSKVKKGFMIVAASIKSVDLFLKNPDEQGYAIINLPTQDDVGSYLASVTTIKHTEDHLTVLVANVSGTIELFDIRIEKSTSGDNTDSDDDVSNESDEIKRKDSKDTKEDHIEIDPAVNLKELIEMRRQKDHFSELEELSEINPDDVQDGDQSAVVRPPVQEGTVILESLALKLPGHQESLTPQNPGTRTDLAGGMLTNPAIASTQLMHSSIPASELQLKPIGIDRGQSGDI